jgi:predicted ATP-dependent protease
MKHCRCNQLAIVGANSQHVRQAQIRLTNRAHRLQGQIGAEMKQAECGNQLKAIAMD